MKLQRQEAAPTPDEVEAVTDLLDTGDTVLYAHTHQRPNRDNGMPEWHRYEITVIKRLDESTDEVLQRVSDAVNYAIRKRVS